MGTSDCSVDGDYFDDPGGDQDGYDDDYEDQDGYDDVDSEWPKDYLDRGDFGEMDELEVAVGSLQLGATRRAPAVVELLNDAAVCGTRIGALIAAGAPVAVDFEGVNLCRDGKLCLDQIATASSEVLLLDVETLGESCFTQGKLRELLESPSVVKIGYDCRADADALWHLHATRLTNLWDCQVAYCTKRDRESNTNRPDPFVKGLSMALKDCPGISVAEGQRLEEVKTAGLRLFAPEKGGSYQVWADRPLNPALTAYAAADVHYLHAMRDAWGHLLTATEMRTITSARIKKAAEGRSAAKGQHMARKDW